MPRPKRAVGIAAPTEELRKADRVKCPGCRREWGAVQGKAYTARVDGEGTVWVACAECLMLEQEWQRVRMVVRGGGGEE